MSTQSLYISELADRIPVLQIIEKLGNFFSKHIGEYGSETVWREVSPFEFNVTFPIETSHLFC